jgi:hypothetical protein
LWALLEQLRANQTSGLVFLMLLLSVGCSAVCVRTFSLASFNELAPVFFGSFIATLALQVVQLVAELFFLDPLPEANRSRSAINDAFLIWLWPLMVAGYRTTLKIEDLPQETDSSDILYQQFEKHWEDCRNTSNPLLRALFRSFRYQIALPAALAFFGAVFAVTLPLILKALVIYLLCDDSPYSGRVLTDMTARKGLTTHKAR